MFYSVLDEYFLVRSKVEGNSKGPVDQGASSSQPLVEDLLETDSTIHAHEMLTVDLTQDGEEDSPCPQIGLTMRGLKQTQKLICLSSFESDLFAGSIFL